MRLFQKNFGYYSKEYLTLWSPFAILFLSLRYGADFCRSRLVWTIVVVVGWVRVQHCRRRRSVKMTWTWVGVWVWRGRRRCPATRDSWWRGCPRTLGWPTHCRMPRAARWAPLLSSLSTTTATHPSPTKHYSFHSVTTTYSNRRIIKTSNARSFVLYFIAIWLAQLSQFGSRDCV